MEKTLIIVDMQNGFCKSKECKELAKKIKDLINLKIFDNYIFTKFINQKDSPFFKIMNWKEMTNSPDTDIIKELETEKGDLVEKHQYGFNKREPILCSNEVFGAEIYICGVDTDACVLKIAVDFFEENIKTTILTQYCYSSAGEVYHQAGLKCLERLIGKDNLNNNVISSKQDLKK